MEECIKFGNWLVIHTDDAGFTQAPCRIYKNRTYTIKEIYEIYLLESYKNK